MKNFQIISVLSLFASAAPAIAQSLTTVTWSNFYDNADQSTSIIACADWAAAHNFTTLGDVPSFPRIGGAFTVSGNTSACGACITILDEQTKRTIWVTVVDAATDGVVLSLEALNNATENNAQNLGSIQGLVTQGSCNP